MKASILILVLTICSSISALGQCRALAPMSGEPNPCVGVLQQYSVHDDGSDVVWVVTGNPSNPPIDPRGYYRAYAWSTPGQYTVTASIPGCSFIPDATRTMTINVGNSDLTNPLYITGPSSPCLNVLNTLSVPAVPDESKLQWSIYPPDPANSVTQRGRFMDVNFSKSGIYTVTVMYQNSQCAASTSGAYYIQAGLPTGTAINGPSSVCAGVSNSIYSPSPTSSQYTYAWSLLPTSAGVIVPSGNNASVAWGANGVEATVRLTITNSCGSTIIEKPVSVKPLPAKPEFTTDKTKICSTDWLNLSISNKLTSYTTSFIPTPTSTLNPTTATPSIKLNSSSALKIKYTSSDGCIGPESDPRSIEVTNISFEPGISGSNKVCTNTTATYSANGVAAPYSWSVPPNVCLVNGTTQTLVVGNSVSIKWLVAGHHTIRLISTNTDCGIPVNAANYDVQVQQPIDGAQISDIEGPATVCTSSLKVPYHIRYPLSGTGATSNANITWQITNGSVLASSGTPAAFVQLSGPNTHVLTATITNSCGGTYQKTKSITSVSSPLIPISAPIEGTPAACPDGSQIYEIRVPDNNTYYWQSSGSLSNVPFPPPQSPPGTKVDQASISFGSILNFHYVAYAVRNPTCDQFIDVLNVRTERSTQTITPIAVTGAVYQGTSTLTATSITPITFRALDATRVSISGNSATFLKAGLCPIVYSNSATNCYYQADDVVYTINVAKKAQTINPTTLNPICAESTGTLTVTSTSGLPVTFMSANPNIATVQGNIVTAIAAGQATIYADQAGDDNYSAAPRISLLLTVNAKPPIPTADNKSVCIGGAAPLTGTPSGGIWTGTGVTGNVFNSSGLTVGNHTVTYSVTNSYGCSSAKDATVTVIALPSVTPNSATVCQNNTVQLSGTPSGGTWSGLHVSSSGIFNAAGLSAGDYSVTYTYTNPITGCSNSGGTVVKVKAIADVSPGSDITICSGGLTDINPGSNIPGTTFTWTVAPTNVSGASYGGGTTINQQLTNTTAGTATGTATYTVSVARSSTVCTGTSDNIVVTVNPVATINSSTTRTVCSGEGFTHANTSTYPQATFTWTATPSKPGIFTGLATSGTGNIVGPLTHTDVVNAFVTYRVTPYAGSCAGTSKDIVITVKSNPSASISGPNIVCSGTSGVTLTANPAGSSYLWSNAKTTRAITATAGGTYSVTITHSSGCKSMASKTLTSGTTPPAPTINVMNNYLSCTSSGGSAQLVSSQADAYSWSNGGASQMTTVFATGTYTVTITKNGCTKSASKYVTCPGGGSMAMAAESTTQEATKQKGSETARGVEELNYADGEILLLYPNPVDDELIVQLATPSETATPFRLINQFGQNLVESNVPAKHQSTSIHTKDLPEGMYLLEVIYEQGRIIKKVMIMH